MGDEDYLHLRGADGKWNDFDVDTTVNYYIIEYGGMPGETATTSGLIELTIESIEASGSTYNIFDDEELVSMVDAENESATRFARNSMDSVLDRLHEFRLRNENREFKKNNISLQVNLNEITLRKHRKGTGIVGAMNYTHCDMEGYTSSILANHLGVAIGSCLGQLSKDIEAVDRTVAIIGDGALEEGRFWESLIMTKTQNLPMDIVIEDNNWSMQSSISQRRCKIQLKAIAEGFGINYVEATDNCAITFVDSGPRLLHFELETLGSTILKKSTDILFNIALTNPVGGSG